MCTQVPLISVDVSKMVGIKTILGEPEEVKPLVAGAGGFATVTFADGVIHPTDTPNLFFGIAFAATAKTKAKAKPKGKAKAKGKDKAKGKGKGRGQRARGSAEAAGSEDGEVGEEADPGSDEAEEQPALPLAEVGGDADELQEPPEKMARQDSVFYM